MLNKVISLEERRAQETDTVQMLRGLLVRALAGDVVACAIAWRGRDGKHAGVTTGLYATDHLVALGAATKLWSQINDAHDLSN